MAKATIFGWLTSGRVWGQARATARSAGEFVDTQPCCRMDAHFVAGLPADGRDTAQRPPHVAEASNRGRRCGAGGGDGARVIRHA